MRGRLPTEAEWEFAAKSCDSDHLFPWGNDPPVPLRQQPKANIFNPYGGHSNQGFGPAEVKTFPQDQTEQHVFDLAGNVSELCLDAYKPYAELIPPGNSKSSAAGTTRVSRSSQARISHQTTMSSGGDRFSSTAEQGQGLLPLRGES